MGVLSALARSRLAALSKAGSLPFHEEAAPLLARRAARRGVESDVDPRLVLGGGALGMFPTGAATATALNEYAPWEAQFQRENEWLSEAERRMRELQEFVWRLRNGMDG